MRLKELAKAAAGIVTVPEPRRRSASPRLDEAMFKDRFKAQFQDPTYAPLQAELERIAEAAWDAYAHERKSPSTRKAGVGYADPDYGLSLDWIAAKQAIEHAKQRHDDSAGPHRILLINGSSHSEHTCPGELSKSWRLVQLAQKIFEGLGGFEIEFLDLSRVASEYGRHIHPCKACFSTAAALCHWPCSCYPNHSLGHPGLDE